MALDPTRNQVARFRIEGGGVTAQYCPVPLDGSKDGCNCITVVSADPATFPGLNCNVVPPVDVVTYCVSQLKALAAPAAPVMGGPYCVALSSLQGQPANSVSPTAISGGVGGQP